MKKIEQIDFTCGNITRNILLMVMPLIVALLFNTSGTIVDSLWVGNLIGESAMAAITVTTPIVFILGAVVMGWSNSIVIILSRVIGEKDEYRIKQVISTAFRASVCFAIIMVAFCFFASNSILRLLNTPTEIFYAAKTFFDIYMTGFIFMFMNLYIDAILRSYGNTKIQMYSIIIGTLFNIVIDPIFIKSFGLNGSAMATVFSQAFTMLVSIFYMFKGKITLSMKTFDFKILKAIVKQAVPSIVQQSIPSVSTSFVTSVVAGFGVAAIAGFGVAGKMETLLLLPPMAFNMVLTSCVGQCFGAKKYDVINKYYKKGIILGGLLLFILTSIIVVFSGSLAKCFGIGGSSAVFVKNYFMIISVGYIGNVITNCALGVINGYGKSAVGMFLMFFYYIIVRIPLAFILSKTSLMLNGIWIAVLVSHIAALIAANIYLYRKFKKVGSNIILED